MAVEYDLLVGDVLEKVGEFNADLTNRSVDSVTSRVFSNGFSAEDVEEQVYVIGKLWKAVHSFSSQVAEGLCRNLRDGADQLRKVLGRLEQTTIENDPDRVVDAAAELMHLFRADKMYYSFATKFLHWCTREHFPIMDSKARTGIRSFGRDVVPGGYGSGDTIGPYLKDYGEWIRFYSLTLRGIRGKSRHERKLRRADSGAGVPNSLLRILDKYFWMKGLPER